MITALVFIAGVGLAGAAGYVVGSREATENAIKTIENYWSKEDEAIG